MTAPLDPADPRLDPALAAQAFAAMGSEARLEVLRILVRAGEPGLAVSAIGAATGIAPSTLSHHLKFLDAAGLIRRVRDGRVVHVSAHLDRLEALAGFITRECCADVGGRDHG
ncbi:winged helix-turn-helix transcriptional regulator [Jannaschia sp. Os4]|uniref:ArsR/SmtB family transcription factor n=1 Tax=Jannaschia sp. Os4 TaxID=2807617 RepID=UPI001939AC83|nr:metalloregulator ArsR/SmtB family transcription factor [Jannaschia sp. Os4]MBM2575431.1 winged helix-turn-helix transcriptional regulator [Jannaschia sp. Os4]